MKFFFPDSVDQIDPDFDFVDEDYSRGRLRQRGDRYAHEVFDPCPYDGVLVSRAVVEGTGGGRYTIAQRHRLYREGVHRFFRLPERKEPILAMGDCGAFNYVAEPEPPLTVDEVIDFYQECHFDLGISVDHVILGHRPTERDIPPDWVKRRELTLELAKAFLNRCRKRRCRFEPVGAAQGWSPASYAHSVQDLQRIGYRRIALGGMVPLKTPEILACLHAVADVKDPDIQLHLLGVTRCEHITRFARLGVTSFDSTSPFRQAFKDSQDNYYALDRTYVAIRVPQVDANAKLKRRILAGEVSQSDARQAERESLAALRSFDRDECGIERPLEALARYTSLFDPRRDRTDDYRELLEARPWKRCECAVCRSSGVEVAVFRGSERNKRRGFHNIFVFRRRLDRELANGNVPPPIESGVS